MEPIIKWPGGKRRELAIIDRATPRHCRRTVEPFAGGAAVSWHNSHKPAIINDLNEDLLAYYSCVKNRSACEQMCENMMAVNAARLALGKLIEPGSNPTIGDVFISAPMQLLSDCEIKESCRRLPKKLSAGVLRQAATVMTKKSNTTKKWLETGIPVSPEAIIDQARTGLQSALYNAIRDEHNRHSLPSKPWESACWWYIRHLCYSSMFRYNKNGDFNVPYGGKSYNTRDFSAPIERLLSAQVGKRMDTVTLEKGDFRTLVDKYNGFDENDFVFLDPPYDTAFSKYTRESAFCRKDHADIKNFMRGTKAKCMLIIKETPFICDLYSDTTFYVSRFDKHYQANFRNRHGRDTTHMMITNYPRGQTKAL